MASLAGVRVRLRSADALLVHHDPVNGTRRMAEFPVGAVGYLIGHPRDTDSMHDMSVVLVLIPRENANVPAFAPGTTPRDRFSALSRLVGDLADVIRVPRLTFGQDFDVEV